MENQGSSDSLAGHHDPAAVAPLLRAGLDALGFGFAIFDRELRLIASNAAFRSLRGYPEALCKPGTPIADLFRFNAAQGDYGDGDIEAQVATRLKRAGSRKPKELEYRLASGRVLSIRYAPIARGGLLLTYADITERKRAEQALAESEERYTLAMAGANEGMWDWVAGSDDIVVSDSYKRLIGLDLPGNRITLADWVALIHPDDLKERERARKEHLTGRAEFYDCEYRVRRGDGRYHWFRDRAQSRRDADGHVIRMAGSLADVTARRRAEDDLREASARIGEQNDMLSALSEKLSKYLSPQVYSSIFSGRQDAGLTSRRRKLTVFFSDIAGFTEITERLESEELTTLLNHYLTEMSRIALEHGATIDKYIGDAVMAFFGDPESRGSKQDALACVRMAMAMQRRMIELAQLWHDQGVEQPFRVRVGISTGFCTVGNFGSEDRMDYTIVGNEVNLASRLQSHARPGEILVAHETFSLVKDAIAFEEHAAVVVKGLSRPIRCYRVIGSLDELKAEGRIIREYDEGVRIFLDLYRCDRARIVRVIEDILQKLKSI